jgi:hypothetical protein
MALRDPEPRELVRARNTLTEAIDRDVGESAVSTSPTGALPDLQAIWGSLAPAKCLTKRKERRPAAACCHLTHHRVVEQERELSLCGCDAAWHSGQQPMAMAGFSGSSSEC